MENTLIARFEKQIESLLSQFDQMRKENAEWKGKMAALTAERDSLKEKNEKTAATLEKMIEKLQHFMGDHAK